MEILLGVSANLVRAFTIYRIFNIFFVKKNKHPYAFCSIIFFVFLTSGSYYIYNNFLITLISNIIGLWALLLIYNGHWPKKILVSGIVYILNIIIESIVLYSLSSLQSGSNLFISVSECIASLAYLLILYFLEKKSTFNNEAQHENSQLWLLLFIVPLVSIAIILSLLWNSVEATVNVITSSGLLIINITIFFLFEALQKYLNEVEEQRNFQQLTKHYENELEITKNSYYKIRSLKHDMKHHLIELKYLAQEHKDNEIIEYIENMDTFIENPEEFVNSGNKDIDSTLNYLLQKAVQDLDSPDISILLPDQLEKNTFLFNVIAGNLIDNAIRAAKMTANKYLKIVIKYQQGLLLIYVKNSHTNNIIEHNNIFETTKSQAENHGFGLKTVKKMVNEYNGEFNVEYDQNFFITKVLIYIDL